MTTDRRAQLLERIERDGPVHVEDLLGVTDRCEGELNAHLSELRAAGRIELVRTDNGPAYRLRSLE